MMTLFHCAAQNGHTNIMKYLIKECNCNPFCLDSSDCTPLFYTSSNGHLDVVCFLTLKLMLNVTLIVTGVVDAIK